jgi:hypothetical protein
MFVHVIGKHLKIKKRQNLHSFSKILSLSYRCLFTNQNLYALAFLVSDFQTEPFFTDKFKSLFIKTLSLKRFFFLGEIQITTTLLRSYGYIPLFTDGGLFKMYLYVYFWT